jgi:hypothetical protein
MQKAKRQSNNINSSIENVYTKKQKIEMNFKFVKKLVYLMQVHMIKKFICGYGCRNR